MKKVMITGVGLNAEIVSSRALLSATNIDSFPVKQLIDDEFNLFQKDIAFRSIGAIKREDRSLLNDCAKLSIDAAMEAFSLAESSIPYSSTEKNDFSIYIARGC